MRTLSGLIPLIVALTVSSGCQQSEPVTPSMMHQVLSALQSPNQEDRDAALADACMESAMAGDTESILLGVSRIEDIKLHDQVAQDCFSLLVDINKIVDAKRVAALIKDPAKQKELSATLSNASTNTP